jgi:PiT family inorganic phosphate transporter
MFGLSIGLFIVLVLCIIAAMAFEFINGFHDTANAVATVIYTRSLKPKTAVILSGISNFLGLIISARFFGLAVAIGIMNLLPLDALIDQNIEHSIAIILSLILTAIIWNLGTWYFGIPCSSSHTLIGSIFGVGVAFIFLHTGSHVDLNWKKIGEVGLSLLISPVIGFLLTFLMMIILKKTVKKKKFFGQPDPVKKPPFWVRVTLILASIGVSYTHGSNDGQKGVGLMMIILITVLPSLFSLNPTNNPAAMHANVQQVSYYISKVDDSQLASSEKTMLAELKHTSANLDSVLSLSKTTAGIPEQSRFYVRKNILILTSELNAIQKKQILKNQLTSQERSVINKNANELQSSTEYAPPWVLLLIAFSLGLGTMVGWKRIVVTIGEKIGKSHLSYAQGAASQFVAAATIYTSSLLGLPVSTTHVLSSGVAGGMYQEGGRKNLQKGTIMNILIAWVVTIPVTVIMAALLYLLFRWMFA